MLVTDSSVSPPDQVPGKGKLSVQAQGGDPPDVWEGECLFIAELFKGYADTLNPVEEVVVNKISSRFYVICADLEMTILHEFHDDDKDDLDELLG